MNDLKKTQLREKDKTKTTCINVDCGLKKMWTFIMKKILIFNRHKKCAI